ncbi:MAG: hypothetical protein IPM71_06000 [Bacteroidota bacterium]|nr:MAG: hypothetical protein IPM71_06000 [Bacteroidota bacterium]
MISYQFNNNLQILEVEYSGEVDLNQLIEYGEKIKNDGSLPRNLLILTDATKANYRFEISDTSIILDTLKEQLSSYTSVRTAVIHQRPMETAFSMALEVDQEIPGYQHMVFATRTAALNWLLAGW